jgi:hypothetical protein
MGEPKSVDAVSFNPATGALQFHRRGQPVQPLTAITEVRYRRTKGDKVLNQAVLSEAHLVANPNRALEQYSLLFAIDTNTKKVDDLIVSVTCVVLGLPLNDRVPGHTVIQFGPRLCVEFRGAAADQERIGWWEIIGAIKRNPTYNDQTRVGLIVDAHLGSLAKINKGEEPVYGDTYLPPNMTMLYASSDTPNETIANKMLAMADKEATVLLNSILSEASVENLTAVAGKPYSHTRQWNL